MAVMAALLIAGIILIRIFFQTTKTGALLTIPKCKRSDTGRYNVSLTNSSGTVEISLKATVLSPPSAPKAPISTKDMMGDSCVLQWGAPDDNGGADITNYIVERKPSGTTQ